MIIDLDECFPEGLSDEAALALRDLLGELLMQFEGAYSTSLERAYRRRRQDLFDPEKPWKRLE